MTCLLRFFKKGDIHYLQQYKDCNTVPALDSYVNESGNPYNPSSIKRMIESPVYWGNIVNGKSKKPSYRESKKVMQPQDKWVLHYDPERVPPLIDKELWDKANYILLERGKIMKTVDCSSKDSLGGGKFAYSSRIVCAEHDRNYIHAMGRWEVDGVEKRAEYWRCSLYKKYGRKQCESPLLYTRDLNKIMRNIFQTIIPMFETNFDSIAKVLEQVLAPQNNENDVIALEKQKSEMVKKKDKLVNGWMNGVISDVDYKNVNAKIEIQLSDIEDKISDITHIRASMNVLEKSTSVMAQVVKNANLESDEAIEELVRCFVKKIVVRRKQPDSNDYVFEIWLFNSKKAINVQSSLCARTYPNRGHRIAQKAV